MRVLSLFDGMSCGQIALKELGYQLEYYASEIDKHAINQTQLNFPGTIQLGDVTKWKEWNIDWHFDLLLAGSPCQGFSFAGKQLAFNDPRSKLFFVFVDILNHIKAVNPDVKFLLENVRMKDEHEAVITQYTGVNPIVINSALVSAQNRVRLYWTNIGMVQLGLFGEWYPGIPLPEDRGILLKDILETDVPKKYFLSQKMLEDITYGNKENGEIANLNKGGERGSVYGIDNKMSCLTATDYKQPKQILIDANYIVAEMGRGKNNGKAESILKGSRIRRLTVTECSRLQTIPDWYVWQCSDTQTYKMLGNGWNVETIIHILKYLNK